MQQVDVWFLKVAVVGLRVGKNYLHTHTHTGKCCWMDLDSLIPLQTQTLMLKR